ncbi:MAG: hypothetical protein ACJ71P_03465 [Nitrososphaeraceae archaeon]
MDYQSDNDSTNQVEVRRVQTIHGNSTFVLVLPKDFVSLLHISKGDYVKCMVSDKKLIIEKADF